MSSWRERLLVPLAAGADQPRRTAAAFAVGAFLGFSPILGIQIGTGLLLAYLLRLSRPAVVMGLCVNLPWLMVPYYTLATLAGAALLGIGVPADAGARFAVLAGLRVWTGEFWRRGGELLAPFLWAYVTGSTAGALVIAAVAFVVAERFLLRVRAARAR